MKQDQSQYSIISNRKKVNSQDLLNQDSGEGNTVFRSKMHNQQNMQWLKKRKPENVPKKYMYYPHEMKRNREIKNVFDNIDKNKSGSLDMNSILNMFQKYNFNIGKEKIQALYDVADDDRDNALNWKEFKKCAFNENANKIFSEIMREVRKEQEEQLEKEEQKLLEQKQYNKWDTSITDKLEQLRKQKETEYLPMNFGNMISFLSYRQTREEISTEIGNIGTKDQKLTDLETFQKLQELFKKSEEYQQNQQSMSTNPIALQMAEKKMEVADLGSFKKYKKNFQENEFKSFFEKLEKQDKQNKEKYLQDLRKTQTNFAMNSSKNSNNSINNNNNQFVQNQNKQLDEQKRAQTSGVIHNNSQIKSKNYNEQPKTSNLNNRNQKNFKNQPIGSPNYTPNWQGFSKRYFSGTLSDFGFESQKSQKNFTKSYNFNDKNQQNQQKRQPKNIRDMEYHMQQRNVFQNKTKLLDKILTDNKNDQQQNQQLVKLRDEVQSYIQKAKKDKEDILQEHELNQVQSKEYQDNIIEDLKQQLIPQQYNKQNQSFQFQQQQQILQNNSQRYQNNSQGFASQKFYSPRMQNSLSKFSLQMDHNNQNLKINTQPINPVRKTNKIPLDLMKSVQDLKKIDEKGVYQNMGHTFYKNNIYREMGNIDLKEKIRKISIDKRKNSIQSQDQEQNSQENKNLIAYDEVQDGGNNEKLEKSRTANQYYQQNKVNLKTQDCLGSEKNLQSKEQEKEKQEEYDKQLIQDLNKEGGIMEKQQEPDILPESLKGSPKNSTSQTWQFQPMGKQIQNNNNNYKTNSSSNNNNNMFKTVRQGSNFSKGRHKYLSYQQQQEMLQNQQEGEIKQQLLCLGHSTQDSMPILNKSKSNKQLTKQQGVYPIKQLQQ